ncbi:phytase [Mitsuaria sp. WAJ17]|nr:phytase [Mitsuaria sp. WAJ17]
MKTIISAWAVGLLALTAPWAQAGETTLTLDKGGLHLLDAQGRELDRHVVRAKRWDQRGEGEDRVAVLLDADRSRPLLARVRGGRLQVHALPVPDFEVEALCLHRDPQGLLHLFLLGNDGLSEQWLLGEHATRPLRRLATAPHPQGCSVDDSRGLLQFGEPGVGQWFVATEAEGRPRRWLNEPAPAARRDWPVLQPSAQTEPVGQQGDAADDPAIWVAPHDGRRSLVLGTNKKQGLLVYGLDGRQHQLLPVGRINNVDLRQGIRTGGRRWDLAVATQRDEQTLVLFGIDGQGHVAELARLPTDLRDIYGLCVGRTPDGQLDAFPNDKDGRVQQYRIEQHEGRWQARLLRQFKLDSQPEGCVVDEREGRLFVGEEKRGIWALDARAEAAARPQLVMHVGGELVADVEGLAIYQGRRGAPSYLVVSSQGSDSYLVLDARPPFGLRGGFRIGINEQRGIDGASETDGLEVTSANLGGPYTQGLLVVQDGHKRLPDGRQNFKLLPWIEVARALKLP